MVVVHLGDLARRGAAYRSLTVARSDVRTGPTFMSADSAERSHRMKATDRRDFIELRVL
jgi:hypothetical protein